MADFSLNGKVILLTGASGYFGSKIAEGLANSGAQVILTGRSKERLDLLADTIRLSGGEAHVILLDVGNEESHAAAVGRIEDSFGQLNGIINNAYSGKAGDIDKIGGEDFAKACKQNLSGPFDLIHRALPLLEKSSSNSSNSASIVNVASMYGHVSPDPRIYGSSGQNNPIHYGATKAGLVQMTRYLACHLASKNIRVNSISPGAFPNPKLNSISPEFIQQLNRRIPLSRTGNSSEIVGPIIFLLSPASSYITGADLAVDGGWTAW